MQKTELLEVLCFSSMPAFVFLSGPNGVGKVTSSSISGWSSYPILFMGAGVASFLEHKNSDLEG